MMNNTMTDKSNIERIVMQRVHLIRALRFAVSSSALSMLVTVAALWGIGREVWVDRVLQNAPANLLNLPQFYFSAFMNTHLIVQVLVVLTIGALIYVAREISRALAFISAAKGV
ncbi:MAG: hypothetical protein G01um101491_425 [Parcubacteria group bacterium Gr01-1014_91]|nr:MAG: hypothetical protein G01um101491_425 [Parcubacteria group bacterium Gr01-1014_91]